MKYPIYLVIFFLVLSRPSYVGAQDFHYTQNYNFITLENPANTGNFDYDHLNRKYRSLFLYRNQWRSIKSTYVSKNTPFETFRVSSDGAFQIANLLKYDYLGVGMNVLRESSGDLNLTNQRAEISLSYNKRLDNRNFSYLCFGIAPTFNQKSVELQNAYYDSQWNGKNFDPSLPTGERSIMDKFSHFGVNAGLLYRNTNILRKFNFTSGISIHNLTEPRANFVQVDNPLKRRYIIHTSGIYRLKPLRNIYFNTHYWFQGNLREFNITSYRTIGSSGNDDVFSYLGIGVRVVGGLTPISNDAVSLHFIQDYKDFRFSVSYDLNFSKLRQATGIKGAIELGIIFFASNNKTHKKIPSKYKYGNTDCPPHLKPRDLDFR